MSIRTYIQPFFPDSLTFEMAKESGKIYTKALLNNKKGISISENKKIMAKYVKKSSNNTKYLQSQSAQASYESYFTALEGYFESLKSFKKNPKKFSGEPKPPRKSKFMFKITFKKTSIRRKGGELWLSAKKPNEPIKIKWAEHLPIPTWVIISYDRFEGWNISLVVNTLDKTADIVLDSSKLMSVDLGEVRVGTTFNSVNHEVKTYSGKDLRSLTRLRNKIDGRIKSKRSQYKKGSRRYKKIARVGRRIVKRIKNKQKNILHNYSSMIVKDCVANKIGSILIGDNSGTHVNTNLGKNNQKVQQGLDRRLAEYINYKFHRVGGTSYDVPEHYTSRTCPKCRNVNKASPKGRTFICDSDVCNYTYDRDGVGCIDIMIDNSRIANVSFDQEYWLDVVGGLTPPIGVKLKQVRSTKVNKVNKISVRTSRLSLDFEGNFLKKKITEPNGSVSPCGLEEPHVL